MRYFNVAVPAPLQDLLTYQTSDSQIQVGEFVTVPLGKRKVQGLILSEEEKKPPFEIKDILQREEAPILDESYLQWIQWVSRYYLYPIGWVARSFCPPKNFKLKQEEIEKKISPLSQLNEEQAQSFKTIKSYKDFKVHLLHGVTGSGKTEVYFHLIEEQIKKNQQVLVMIPEISLTSQLYSRFSNQFPNHVGVIHSGLKGKKRYQEWVDFTHGRKNILLGARSALFCPLPRLSMIIIDEEHESHFKQEEKLRYQARDSAIKLAQIKKIPIVLGSATPSLNTWFKVQKKEYQYSSLKNRFQNQSFPQFKIVDLKNQKKELPFWLSTELFQSIKQTLEDKKQVALFLNRRGQSPLSMCLDCGKIQMCPNCDISLTLHSNKYLICHYCNYSVSDFECSECKGEVSHLGIGTQGVGDEVQKLFPEARIQVADSDHVRKPEDFEKLVKDMEDKKIDILIGTQMIAKGFDFPNLHLVGFILADLSLYGHDYRAVERSFQTFTQMGGRAGRRQTCSGKVILQTYNPDHWVIQSSVGGSFEEMAQRELEHRNKLFYPPFCRLASIRISSPQEKLAQKVAGQVVQKIKTLKGMSFECLGPSPEPIFKLRMRYRYHILVKSKSSSEIQRVCEYVDSFKKDFQPIRIEINRDP